MLTQTTTIVNKLGLHARAAAKFVGCASAFSSKVRIAAGEAPVDGKSIMSVMMLAAGNGTEVTLEVDGADEAAAMDALLELIANRFDEAE